MIDSAPFDEWSDKLSTFWTWGGGGSTGTLTLTALGMLLMVVSLLGWVWLENKKLWAQTDRLRAARALEPTTVTTTVVVTETEIPPGGSPNA
jgi:hypothetical protein